MRSIARLAGWIIGGLFIYAGVLKAIDPAAFAADVRSFQLLSYPLATAVALYLPWLEIVSGAAIFTRRWAPAGRVVLVTLLLVFLAVIGVSWWRGLDVTCGCFGAAANKTGYGWLVTRDLLMLAAALLARPKWATAAPQPPPSAATTAEARR